jgi:hypothetical protein
MTSDAPMLQNFLVMVTPSSIDTCCRRNGIAARTASRKYAVAVIAAHSPKGPIFKDARGGQAPVAFLG